MEGISNQEPVFFLIDEMLKGTNALDRHHGSRALLQQLIKKGAKGIVATHDLELTLIEQQYSGEFINYHFDGKIINQKLSFDYKLKKGICQSFNALTLMRKMGINVNKKD